MGYGPSKRTGPSTVRCISAEFSDGRGAASPPRCRSHQHERACGRVAARWLPPQPLLLQPLPASAYSDGALRTCGSSASPVGVASELSLPFDE
jgi:hypothetical protein